MKSKKSSLLILLSILLMYSNKGFTQEKAFARMKEALEYHLNELKSNIGQYNNIYIVTSIDDRATLPPNVFQIENSLNPKFLKKKEMNFLVKLIFHPGVNGTKFDAVNYKVVKLSKRKLKLINLSNGNTYIIPQ